MVRTILSTYKYVQGEIATRGDGILPRDEDPFIYNQLYGAYIEARSAGDHSLTWSYLEAVVVSLYNALYNRGRFRSTAFLIVEAGVLIGTGNLREDSNEMLG